MTDAALNTTLNYTTLSAREIAMALDEAAHDADATFGQLDAGQLNWQPDPWQWSIAQCLEHLLTANRLMFKAADEALNGRAAVTIWQRLPLLPGMFGRALIRSQAPDGTRKYKANSKAQPASHVSPDVVPQFVEQQRQAAKTAQTLDPARVERVIMTSPFVRVITYSVLDGWRLVVAHDHRHMQQARRVLSAPGFPSKS